MPRKPRDIDAELRALEERSRRLKIRRVTQLGELVSATGADSIPLEALAGALLAAVEQAREEPDAVTGWAERGAAFFRGDAKQDEDGRGKRNGGADPAPGSRGDGAPVAAGDNPAA